MESKKINQLATELTPALDDLTIIGDPTTGISKKITLSQMASLFTGTVEEYANLAAFPLIGTADTIYIALDTNVLYRWDTSLTSYVELSPNIINSLVFSDANGFDGNISLIGSVATLTITTALTTGSVPFIGASGALSQDNANLFFDDTNNRLGVNTNVPTTALDVFGSGIIGRLNGTSTNNAYLGFASVGSNKWSIGNVQSDHRFRIYSEANTSELVSVLQTGEFGIGIANPTTKFHIDGAASALIANLDANVSVAKSISFRSDNSNRINLEVSGTESGSNAGANFFIRRYSDAGSLIDTPLTITRSTGEITLAGALSGTSATFSGAVQVGTTSGYLNVGSNVNSGFATYIKAGASGILLSAGTTSSDNALLIQNQAETTTLFNIKGNGVATFSNNLAVGGSTDDTSGGLYSNIALNGTSYSRYSLLTGGTARARFQFDGTNTSITTTSTGGKLQLATAAATAMEFITNDTLRLTISSGGVTTINGTFVQNPSSGSGGLYIDRGTSTQSPYISWFNGSGTRLGYMGFSNTNIGLYLENSAAFIVSAGDTYLGTSTTDKNSRLVSYGNSTTSSSFALRCYSSGSDVLFGVRNDGLINTGLFTYSPYNFSITGRDVYVNSSGELGYLSSVRESKININNIENVDWLLNLNPVSFNKRKRDEEGKFTDEFYNELDFGLIAEEAELINDQICFYDETEEGKIIRGVSYTKLITPMLKMIQQQQAQIEELKALINK